MTTSGHGKEIVKVGHLKVSLLLLDADGELLLEVLDCGVERGEPALQVELGHPGEGLLVAGVPLGQLVGEVVLQGEEVMVVEQH